MFIHVHTRLCAYIGIYSFQSDGYVFLVCVFVCLSVNLSVCVSILVSSVYFQCCLCWMFYAKSLERASFVIIVTGKKILTPLLLLSFSYIINNNLLNTIFVFNHSIGLNSIRRINSNIIYMIVTSPIASYLSQLSFIFRLLSSL